LLIFLNYVIFMGITLVQLSVNVYTWGLGYFGQKTATRFVENMNAVFIHLCEMQWCIQAGMSVACVGFTSRWRQLDCFCLMTPWWWRHELKVTCRLNVVSNTFTRLTRVPFCRDFGSMTLQTPSVCTSVFSSYSTHSWIQPIILEGGSHPFTQLPSSLLSQFPPITLLFPTTPPLPPFPSLLLPTSSVSFHALKSSYKWGALQVWTESSAKWLCVLETAKKFIFLPMKCNHITTNMP